MLVFPASYPLQRSAVRHKEMRLARPQRMRTWSAFARFGSRNGSETIGFWLKFLLLRTGTSFPCVACYADWAVLARHFPVQSGLALQFQHSTKDSRVRRAVS